jgi:hypothetical protein
MDKSNIITRLLALPAEIGAAETYVIEMNEALSQAKDALQFKKDELYLGIYESEGMKIDGKNAEIREAQMRQYTVPEQRAVQLAESASFRSKFDLNKLLNEMKALQSIADLLRGAA